MCLEPVHLLLRQNCRAKSRGEEQWRLICRAQRRQQAARQHAAAEGLGAPRPRPHRPDRAAARRPAPAPRRRAVRTRPAPPFFAPPHRMLRSAQAWPRGYAAGHVSTRCGLWTCTTASICSSRRSSRYLCRESAARSAGVSGSAAGSPPSAVSPASRAFGLAFAQQEGQGSCFAWRVALAAGEPGTAVPQRALQLHLRARARSEGQSERPS